MYKFVLLGSCFIHNLKMYSHLLLTTPSTSPVPASLLHVANKPTPTSSRQQYEHHVWAYLSHYGLSDFPTVLVLSPVWTSTSVWGQSWAQTSRSQPRHHFPGPTCFPHSYSSFLLPPLEILPWVIKFQAQSSRMCWQFQSGYTHTKKL